MIRALVALILSPHNLRFWLIRKLAGNSSILINVTLGDTVQFNPKAPALLHKVTCDFPPNIQFSPNASPGISRHDT